MKKLFASFLLLWSVCAFAASDYVPGDGLTKTQLAELKLKAAQMSEDNQAVTVTAPKPSVLQKVADSADATQKWVDVGKSVGAGIGAGARELGVTVNEFAVTPVGKMTTWLIVWKVVGRDAVQIATRVLAFTVIIFFVIPGIWICRFYVMNPATDYEHTKGFLGWTRKRVVTRRQPLSSSDTFWITMWCGLASLLLVGVSLACLI